MFKKTARASLLISTLLVLCILFLPLTTFAAEEDSVIRITDANLKAAIKSVGDITVKDMQALTTLNLTGKPITSLEGLQYATNLEKLQLSGAGLKDIQIIGQLKSINNLNLSTNSITDISPLSNLNNLTVLNLANNQIKNISSLESLTTLNDLNLSNNQITNISPLAQLTNLDKLNLEKNGLTDISVLRNLNKNKVFGRQDQIQLGYNELNIGAGSASAQTIEEIKANYTTVVWEPQQRIQLNINGTYIDLDAPPVVINNRTMIPIRAIFENLGASVEWDAKTKTITGKKDSTNIILTVNNKIAKVNGKNVILDVPATVVSGRAMVPTRFIAETLGKEVKWDAPTRTVIIK